MNYAPSTPLLESIRSYFSYNVVGAIDIRIDVPAIGRAEQTTLDPLTHVLLMLTNRLHVQEAALAGIAFLSDHHGYPH